ncbi:MAG: Ppx/GppA family phosphatase [Acidobacteria bacterium]|nr:Ppx/GppA family phosphatase [Acidobacteriota bacterium]MCB9398101.1 Ppx/GppA family phosphatase [Acidobacteriota bacterium]
MSRFPMVAALDLGSNSFHLVIARVEGEKIYFIDRLKETVRLAEGLRNGVLAQEVQDRALLSLQKLGQRLSGLPEKAVRVVGTNTLRASKNAREFIQSAERILGYPIHVISGQEEARLIYLGVTHHLAADEARRLVVDIGGGSTEIIVGQGDKPLFLESLHMGCVSFTQKFFPKGRLSAIHFEIALHVVQRELEPFKERLAKAGWLRAIGASGTVKAVETCIRELSKGALTICPEGMNLLQDYMIKAGSMDRLKFANLSPMRLPILAGGFIILHGIMRELKIDSMIASPYALREGLLLDLIGRHNNRDIRQATIESLVTRYAVDREQASRVARFGLTFYNQIANKTEDDPQREMLEWAALLHEIGLAISHSSYHKHGAYLVKNSDMPGFDRADQEQLGFLVLNHRRKIRKDPNLEVDWSLLLSLRLAVLFARRRIEKPFPPVLLARKNHKWVLQVEKDWVEARPLTEEDLMGEVQAWSSIGVKFRWDKVETLGV